MQNEIVVSYKPHSGQQKFHDSKARFRALACGTRWGKERCCVPEANRLIIDRANDESRPKNLVPNIHWWAVGPTYALTKQLWREFKYFTPKELIENINETDKFIKWKACYGGVVIEMKSAQSPEDLVSVGLDGVLITETGLLKRKVWEDSIRPRLASRLGDAIFNGTPRGKWESSDVQSLLYEAYLNGQDKEKPDWDSWNFPTWGNPYIPPEEIETLRRDMDGRLFDQNIAAHFLDFALGKSVYPTWDNLMLSPTAHSNWKQKDLVIVGWDRGYHKPAVVWTYINKQDQWVLAREWMGFDVARDDFVKEIVNRTKAYFPGADHIDYAPSDFAQAESDGKSWIQVMKAYGINPIVGRAGRDEVVRRTDAVRQKMRLRADGNYGMLVDPACKTLIDGFSGAYCYPEAIDKPEDEKPLKDGYYDHLQDAVAVIADNHFGERRFKSNLKTIRAGQPKKQRVTTIWQ